MPRQMQTMVRFGNVTIAIDEDGQTGSLTAPELNMRQKVLVQSVDIIEDFEMLDVTTHGDMRQQFIRGQEHKEITIKLVACGEPKPIVKGLPIGTPSVIDPLSYRRDIDVDEL